VVTYQPDSPSRMCVMLRLIRQPAGWICFLSICRWIIFLDPACVYTSLSSSHMHVYTHIDSTSGLVWRTVLRPHTSASSVLPSPLPTHVPALPHTLTSPTSPLICLMYSASAVSSQASVRHGASGRPCVLSSRTPYRMYTAHPMLLACRRRPLDTEGAPAYVLGMSHYGPQCAHTDDTAAPSSSGHRISTRH
jgi:hypothetical protein